MKKRMTQPQDMTCGTPWKLILMFAVPLILGNIFQELYTIVDTMVVGKKLGVNALAAVGATGWVFMFNSMLIQGFTQGFGIQIAKMVGENDTVKLKRAISNSIILSALLSIVLLLGMQLIINPAMHILRIPLNIRDISVTYLRVIFVGIPFSVAYNIFAVILRSLGNSKTPLNAMVISTSSNIVLDILFVVGFQWGVIGAAVATIISQLLSAVYCFVILNKCDIFKANYIEFRLDIAETLVMLKLGTPMAIQNMIITIGGVVLQSFVDSYGVIFMAGYIATTKLYGIIQCAGTAYGFAMVTYTGQNWGAKKVERIRQGLKSGLVLAVVSCLFIAVLMFTFGKQILGLFISGTPDETKLAMIYAYDFLRIMSACLPILYILHIVRSVLQGLGHTMITMLSGVFEMVMRVGGAFVLSNLFGERGLFVTEILAWLASDIVLVSGYFFSMKKINEKS
jgi:putative MATE family efflux protein